MCGNRLVLEYKTPFRPDPGGDSKVSCGQQAPTPICPTPKFPAPLPAHGHMTQLHGLDLTHEL